MTIEFVLLYALSKNIDLLKTLQSFDGIFRKRLDDSEDHTPTFKSGTIWTNPANLLEE